MGLGHNYYGDIDTSVIAWYWSLGTQIPKSSWDHYMHSVFHVVFRYVFHVCDCVIVCYNLRGKTYTRYDVYGKC